jgi:hypothetical protein
MFKRFAPVLVACFLGLGVWLGGTTQAQAQVIENPPSYRSLQRFYYYPYYYFPHNYWPIQSPRWPETPGAHYQRPPAYMAYPPFREPNWRYELWEPQKYYRGFHFWLDQF